MRVFNITVIVRPVRWYTWTPLICSKSTVMQMDISPSNNHGTFLVNPGLYFKYILWSYRIPYFQHWEAHVKPKRKG